MPHWLGAYAEHQVKLKITKTKRKASWKDVLYLPSVSTMVSSAHDVGNEK